MKHNGRERSEFCGCRPPGFCSETLANERRAAFLLLWLPASGLFGTQKVTIKINYKKRKIKDEFRAEEIII